jgi:hypothetical protein
MMRLSVSTSALRRGLLEVLEADDPLAGFASSRCRSVAWRFSAIWRACGRPERPGTSRRRRARLVRPSTWTGREGSASFTGCRSRRAWPARGRARAGHDRVADAQRARWTSTVATAPRPLSRLASTGDTTGVLSGLARRSSSASAVSRTASSSLSMCRALLGRDVDEHGVAAVLLGDQAVLGELLTHLRRVRAVDVDLVDGHTIGTSAACAWLSASTVCGITPSSAATTRIAMSVTLAPRARMAVNASWPGVSMKVMALVRPRARR